MKKKGLTASSQRWLARNARDPWVKAARREGYKSRAAYKLISLLEGEKILKAGDKVLELGGAPGGWSQVICQRLGKRGILFCIDTQEYVPPSGAHMFVGDVLDDDDIAGLRAKIRDHIQDEGLQSVLSDLGPTASGVALVDQLRSQVLAQRARDIAISLLAKGGTLITKSLQGAGDDEFLKSLRQHFSKVKRVKPPASHKKSREHYWVATGFHGD